MMRVLTKNTSIHEEFRDFRKTYKKTDSKYEKKKKNAETI